MSGISKLLAVALCLVTVVAVVQAEPWAKPTRPDLGWLVGHSAKLSGAMLESGALSEVGSPARGVNTPSTSVWRQSGICGLEFLGASVGTAAATIPAGAMLSAAMNDEGKVGLGLASFPTYAISSAVLSAGGTYLMGRLFGERVPFTHALLGGAVGAASGAATLFYVLSSGGREALAPLVVALPPLCATAVYNIWKR